MLKGEIIAVGTELLLGQIVNSNAQYISQKMASIGVPVYYHVAVGDNEERLRQAIITAQGRSNLIIFTGGLGPTVDDLTKEIAAEVLEKALYLNEEAFLRIKDFFKQRQVVMTDNNKKQAMVIEGSTIFQNNHGLAAGFGLEQDGVTYVFLPGPPFEMKPMLDDYVVPWIKEQNKSLTFFSTVMRFIGIGEASLEEEIIDIIGNQGNPTVAPLANEGEVTIRLTASGENIEVAEQMIKPIESEIHKRLEKYHYANGDHSIETVVFHMLKERGLTISASESFTGGLIGSRFTALPGSSQVYFGGVICYDDSIKKGLLNIPSHILETKGAVSEETAMLLAENTLKLFHTDIAISTTGVAGPDSIEGKPVGLIYIGISQKGKQTKIKELHLSGNRHNIQTRATKLAYYYLWRLLKFN